MHDAGVIVADGDCVIVNGRFSGFGEEQSKSKALGSMTDFRQIDITALGLNSAGLVTRNAHRSWDADFRGVISQNAVYPAKMGWKISAED
jgi:hypothetical protein